MVYNKYILYLILSVTLSLVWMILGRKMYGYNKKFPKIFGLCVYPLFGWIIGLFVLALVYDFFTTILSKTLIIIVLIPLFCVLLILAEYIGYHAFSVHNVVTANYPPLPFIDAMHGPVWMRTVYFAMGIIMIFLLAILS